MNELPNWAFRIFQFLSFVPIFRVTCDAGFGEINKKRTLLRFSLLSINLGKYILHFCTFQWFWGAPPQGQSKERFRILRVLSLTEVEKPLDERSFNQRIDRHKQEIKNLETVKKEAIKEALFHKMSSLMDSKNRTFNKFLAYLAVVAFLIPIYTPYLTNIGKSFNHDGILQFLVLVILYYIIMNFLNLILFFHDFIKVKSYSRYAYQDVKNSTDPSTELLQMVYFERYLTEFEWIREITLIRNIEKYIKGIVIMSIALVIVHNVSLHYQTNRIGLESISERNTAVYTLDLSKPSNKLYDGQKTLLDQLENDLLEGKVSEVILIRSGSKNDENYNRIYYLIQSLNVHNIEITTAINDTSPENNELIILLKRR
ncbi:hypothetical protein B1748_08900 [Paenibacillus sp. MY03]|uniref:hypothetical protein n=1 Tax=Paenibacillus sp. MY03 TaxID=302980 RepID=UPI000B3D4675|nr:hypothetical protein [Paenibacillus sp. MY03]OUS77252.1 hypothetical protein B1748_08900 [Paenibacillus sp. MY03]